MSNTLKTIFLLGLLGAALVGLGTVLGGVWPWVMGALALAMNLGAYFFSDSLVLKMQRAEPLDRQSAPRLYAMVEELAVRAEIPTPRLYRIPDPNPNAFATGRNPERGVVAVTDGIVALLSERELRGVIAHEIAHIKNRDILIASVGAMLAGAIGNIANMIQFSAIFGGSEDEEEGGGAGALVAAFIAPIAAMLIQFAVSRSREFQADATGARISGDPEALAMALARLERGAQLVPTLNPQPATASLFIVNPLTAGQRMARWFSTHPATEERVERLMVMAGRRVA